LRNDVKKALEKYTVKELDFINKSELSKHLNCNRRTLDRYIEEKKKRTPNSIKPKRKYASLLDDYKQTIRDMVDEKKITALDIYDAIQINGYSGGYETVAKFLNRYKKEKTEEVTRQFREKPGIKARVILSYSVTITNRSGKSYKVRIFLMVLGYSGKAYIKLTQVLNVKTLLKFLADAFEFYNSIPHELLFDYQSVVVDHSKSSVSKPIFKQALKDFAQKRGIKLTMCYPFCPQLTYHMNALSRLTEKLLSYNNLFNGVEELDIIVDDFLEVMNNEEIYDNRSPNDLFLIEKQELMPLL
jgi:transposase